MLGANFSSWFDPLSGGTLYAEVSSPYPTVPSSTAGTAIISDGTLNNRVGAAHSGGNAFWMYTYGGVATGNPGTDGAVGAAAVFRKYAIGWDTGVRSASCNTRPLLTNVVAASLPSGLNELSLGVYPGGGNNWLDGHIRRIRYWNKRLTNEQLQALTA
jgi:hypothetical protein